MEESGIAADVAALNVVSFGPGTDRHWEDERAELTQHRRRPIEEGTWIKREKTPKNWYGRRPTYQSQSGALHQLDKKYRHLKEGGWRSLSDTLPGVPVPVFDQWKPKEPRQKGKRDDRTGEWRLEVDEHGQPKWIKYEAPPGFPDGGGLLLPRVPERCWRLICKRHGLAFPDAATIALGFWRWVLANPDVPLLICEGWKKALAAISAGHAAVAVPGVTMGHRNPDDGTLRLIQALQVLAKDEKGRPNGRKWVIAFDAERKKSTAAKVGKSAGKLAGLLRAAGGKSSIARLPLLPGAEKTGLDDLWVAGGAEALERALANTGPHAALTCLRAADRELPAGSFVSEDGPLPSPAEAPLLVLAMPMGTGKTEAIAEHLKPLQAVGIPILETFHRIALGETTTERHGVPWRPKPGSDERLQGAGACLDSWCPESSLAIHGHSFTGGVMVLDEWCQQVEHLLLAHGTQLSKRRLSVLRTLADQLARQAQIIAADAQFHDTPLQLLEELTGRRAHILQSAHRPMAGRPYTCPDDFTPDAAAKAFRGHWAQLVESGQPFLCWTSAQKAKSKQAPQCLAAEHLRRNPAAKVLVIDSSTPENAARLAADPDGVAAQYDAIYASPSITSGLSFATWKPATVLIYSGGHIAPQHVAQAAARIRSPEVPVHIYAPERSPGNAMRICGNSTDPVALIETLRTSTGRRLGFYKRLQDAGDSWLQCWAQLVAHRNRQRFAYRVTISGLLMAEGWALQEPIITCPLSAAIATADLGQISQEKQAAEDQAIITAPILATAEAAEVKRRRLSRESAPALARHAIAEAWGLTDGPLTPAILKAHGDGLHNQARRGWLLQNPEAMAPLIRAHDAAQRASIATSDGQTWLPDELRLTLAPQLIALDNLGIRAILRRFADGETISSNDPMVENIHERATTVRREEMAATLGVSPGVYASGTLRTLLGTCGWKLVISGRIKKRSRDRDAQTYTAQPIPLPDGISLEALQQTWLNQLQKLAAGGAKIPPIPSNPYRGEKCPNPTGPNAPMLGESPPLPSNGPPDRPGWCPAEPLPPDLGPLRPSQCGGGCLQTDQPPPAGGAVGLTLAYAHLSPPPKNLQHLAKISAKA